MGRWFHPWLFTGNGSYTYHNFNSLRPNDTTIGTLIWVNIGSGNCLLPDGNNPLPEPMLTNHQWWFSQKGNFTGTVPDIYPCCEFESYKFSITAAFPRGQWVKLTVVWWCHIVHRWRSHHDSSWVYQVLACCLVAPSHYLNQQVLIRPWWPCLHAFSVETTIEFQM